MNNNATAWVVGIIVLLLVIWGIAFLASPSKTTVPANTINTTNTTTVVPATSTATTTK